MVRCYFEEPAGVKAEMKSCRGHGRCVDGSVKKRLIYSNNYHNFRKYPLVRSLQFQPVIDALPVQPMAVQAFVIVEGVCLFSMIVALMALAVQLFFGCFRLFNFGNLVVCVFLGSAAMMSFFTLEWTPGLVATCVVLVLNLFGKENGRPRPVESR